MPLGRQGGGVASRTGGSAIPLARKSRVRRVSVLPAECVFKRCSRCERTLPSTRFHRRSGAALGLDFWCKDCKSRRPKERSCVCVECGVAFKSSAANVLVCGLKCRRARQWKQLKASEVRLAKMRARDRLRSSWRSRVRQELAKAGDVTSADVVRLLASRETCPICHRRMRDDVPRGDPRKKELDHIVPVNVGGTSTIGNVRVICGACNRARPKDGSDVEQESLWARSPA
jgi:hypothetical protein